MITYKEFHEECSNRYCLQILDKYCPYYKFCSKISDKLEHNELPAQYQKLTRIVRKEKLEKLLS